MLNGRMRKQYHLIQVGLSKKVGVGLHFVRELEQDKQTLRMNKVNQVLTLFEAELAPALMDRSKFKQLLNLFYLVSIVFFFLLNHFIAET